MEKLLVGDPPTKLLYAEERFNWDGFISAQRVDGVHMNLDYSKYRLLTIVFI